MKQVPKGCCAQWSFEYFPGRGPQHPSGHLFQRLTTLTVKTSSDHYPQALNWLITPPQSTSLPRCPPGLSLLKSLSPPRQHSSCINYLTRYVPTNAQLCNCAETSNFSLLFPLQHVFAYRHWKRGPSRCILGEVPDPPHGAVPSPLLPVVTTHSEEEGE